MGILGNLQQRQAIEKKAAAFDAMQQQAKDMQIAQQARDLGQAEGLAAIAVASPTTPQPNPVFSGGGGLAAQAVQAQPLTPEEQINLMIQSGEITPEEGNQALMDNRQYNEAQPFGGR